MNRRKEQTVAVQQNRGFNLMPVAHDGAVIACLEGQPTEAAPGVFVTVDPASGIALVETAGSGEARASVAVDGQRVLDVSQLGRGAVLTINGRDYVFLKYMDVYFRPRSLDGAASASVPVVTKAVRSARPVSAINPVVANAEILNSAFLNVDGLSGSAPTKPRRPRRLAVMLGPVAAVLALAGGLMLLPSGPDKAVSVPKTDVAKPTAAVQVPEVSTPPAASVATEPQNLRDLMAEADPQPVAAKPAPVAAAPKAIPSAIQVKQEPAKQVKKKLPVPAARAVAPVPQPALSPAALKAFEGEYEEAVLIRGYDRERSVQMLQQLRKKVPQGTALRQKVEAALKN